MLLPVRPIAGFFMLAIALASVGCDDSGLGDVVPLTGVVLLDGKPAPDVSLTLVPQIGVQGRGGYAKSAADGSFEFQASPEIVGVLPGKYRVLIQKYAMPDGSPIPPNTSAAEVGLVNELPSLYSNPETCPLFANVPADNAGPLTFELKSRP